MSEIEIDRSDDGNILLGAESGDVSASIMVPAGSDPGRIEDAIEDLKKEAQHTLRLDDGRG